MNASDAGRDQKRFMDLFMDSGNPAIDFLVAISCIQLGCVAGALLGLLVRMASILICR